MTSRSGHQHQQQSINNNTNNISLISSDPNVTNLQQIMQSNSSSALPKGKALVLGCGSGHDVVAIACPERYVVGVDISDKAIMKAKEISDHVGGPLYKASIADYEVVLHPMGFKAVSIVENELAIEPRKGREKLGRWKKFMHQPLL